MVEKLQHKEKRNFKVEVDNIYLFDIYTLKFINNNWKQIFFNTHIFENGKVKR